MGPAARDVPSAQRDEELQVGCIRRAALLPGGRSGRSRRPRNTLLGPWRQCGRCREVPEEAASAKANYVHRTMADGARAQLIHIDVDRRLGHEWDEWDGRPLPNSGNYDSSPALFFAWSAITLIAGLGLVALAIFLLAPRLADAHPSAPRILWSALLIAGAILWAWWAALLLSYELKRPLLPEWLAERGPFLRLMRLTSRVAGPIRATGLGRKCRGEGLQRVGAEARTQGGSGRASGADTALPVEGNTGWRARRSPASTGCRSSWRQEVSWPGESSGSAGPALWLRWRASATW